MSYTGLNVSISQNEPVPKPQHRPRPKLPRNRLHGEMGIAHMSYFLPSPIPYLNFLQVYYHFFNYYPQSSCIIASFSLDPTTMPDSPINFTLDTICPWTYLAKARLTEALDTFRTANPSSPTIFTIHYLPYQLYPDAPKEGEDKYAWYMKSKYADSPEKMKMYTTLMAAYGAGCGIRFMFGGVVANTLDAHRVIQFFQEQKGAEVANRIVDCKNAYNALCSRSDMQTSVILPILRERAASLFSGDTP